MNSPAASREVPTGRFMNGSEMFMARFVEAQTPSQIPAYEPRFKVVSLYFAAGGKESRFPECFSNCGSRPWRGAPVPGRSKHQVSCTHRLHGNSYPFPQG